MKPISILLTCVSFIAVLFLSTPCWSEIKEVQPAFQVQAGKLGIVGVHFKSGITTIDQQYMGQLQKIAEVLNSDKLHSARILIKGHSDSKGSASLNLKLSKLRAQKAMELLVNKFGVNESRLACDGVGETSPIASNDTKSGRFLNRRIEFIYLGEINSEKQ
jgi:outer membrane protein OmpA-like peptidoglycan-associated protein